MQIGIKAIDVSGRPVATSFSSSLKRSSDNGGNLKTGENTIWKGDSWICKTGIVSENHGMK